jgi:hypothetical protein
MATRKVFLILVILISSLVSCTKNSTSTNNTTTIIPKTKTQLLTQKAWKITGLRIKIDNGNWIDQSAQMQSCFTDNLYTYSTTTEYNKDEGATKCNTTDPQNQLLGYWVFQNDETRLSIDNTINIGQYSIIILDENTLQLTYAETNGAVVTISEYTYSH